MGLCRLKSKIHAELMVPACGLFTVFSQTSTATPSVLAIALLEVNVHCCSGLPELVQSL